MPFTPYAVQHEMRTAIMDVLHSACPRVVPVAVTEVPTGCGKTMALLSSVLQYQQELKRKTPKEADAYLRARRPPWQQQQRRQQQRGDEKRPRTSTTTAGRRAPAGSGEGPESGNAVARAPDDDKDGNSSGDGWSVPPSFFRHFRVNSQRKIRAELDVTGSQELRRRFLPPPCTIYYATRTHAQLRQAVCELRRLDGAASAIRMNILGSRDRYCIHPKVVHAKANHTLPVEGNNLGEVCDKLVSVGLCEMVDKYDELSCSAIAGPVGHQRGQIWDMEDLVLEGTARHMCPYYAARDLVFFADVNFCTYPYLLDPLIRHETKMEAALLNHAIVVFDEAHNVPGVCQDALSHECTSGVLCLILSELEPLVANHVTLARQPTTSVVSSGGAPSAGSPPPPPQQQQKQDGFATMLYPRELHLGQYTLVEIFAFLYTVIQSLSGFVTALLRTAAEAAGSDSAHHRPLNDEDGDGVCKPGTDLEHHLRTAMEAHVVSQRRGRAAASKTSPALASLELFQRAYGVIMALGVTFNPFDLSIFALSQLKRWLLLLRFLLQKPGSFALTVRAAAAEPALAGAGAERQDARRSLAGAFSAAAAAALLSLDQAAAGPCTVHGVIEVRCLDGSLAFSHLLQSVHRVVLASGTLAPFTQLARDLGLEAALWRTVEGLHVVPPTQYCLAALTAVPATATAELPLRCTYSSMSDSTFLQAVARTVSQLTRTVCEPVTGAGGGVLLFVPNYAVLHALAKLVRQELTSSSAVQVFVEPRKAEALTEVLAQFQAHTCAPRRGTALLMSVYRGKVSEGLDFTDDMARLVLCLGVPLQPLKSWTVVAQRAYSGPEWYVTDAARAVNQALGRCLRHVRDYGAVVLLDDRYAQPSYQERLSKWCRSALQTESSVPQLCARLRTCFGEWRRMFADAGDCGGRPADGDQPAMGTAGDAAVSAKCARLGTEQLPFTRVQRAAARTPSASDVKMHRHTDTDGHSRGTGVVVKRGRHEHAAAALPGGPVHSPLACTAVKLLYETTGATSDVSRQALQVAMQALAENFFDGESEAGVDAVEW